MRYSSMKSIVAALSIVITLFVAVPAATARPAQNRDVQKAGRTHDERTSENRMIVVKQLIQRTLRRLGINSGLTIPTPKSTQNPDGSEATE